jgi:hypothetical protein
MALMITSFLVSRSRRCCSKSEIEVSGMRLLPLFPRVYFQPAAHGQNGTPLVG